MIYANLLNRIIDDGIAAARADYAAPEKRHKLEGSVAGFEACRGKLPNQLMTLLRRVEVTSAFARDSDPKRYWRLRCFAAEVEWVLNVLTGAAAVGKGRPEELDELVARPLPGHPTARGVLAASRAIMGDLMKERLL